MGLVPLGLQVLTEEVQRIGGYKGCRMMEIGDQQMYCHANIPEASAAKSWFEQRGVRHTSVDLNGELGAIPLDLSKQINQLEWDGAFDVVTDFGTSEHVGEPLSALYRCRENCHRWCRPGGLLFFNNPKTGHWPRHGYHYFTLEHYQKLAAACNYRILRLWEHPTLGNTIDGWQTFAVFMKQTKTPFVSEEEFAAICSGTVFKS